MNFRLLTAVGAAAYLLIITSCGTSGSNPVTTVTPVAKTTSLPLQAKGLAVGGDVQSRATDVVARSITEAQAKKIADACNSTVEIASGNQTCAEAIRTALAAAPSAPPSAPCQPSDELLCLQVWDTSNVSGLGQQAVIDIRDDRPGKSLCNSEPDDVCLRVGVPTSSIMDQVVPGSVLTTPSGETPSGETPSGETPSGETPSREVPNSTASATTSSSSPPGGTTTAAGSP